MANELKHKTVGLELTQAEFEDIGLHVLDSQERGDIIFASSAAQLSRLAHGNAGQVLQSGGHGADPSWADPPSLSCTMLTFSRALSDAGGDVAYTGFGFTPSKLLVTAAREGSFAASWGIADEAMAANCLFAIGTYYFYQSQGYGKLIYIGQVISATYQSAIVRSYDPDGFTLTWTKTGSPSGTAYFTALAIK